MFDFNHELLYGIMNFRSTLGLFNEEVQPVLEKFVKLMRGYETSSCEVSGNEFPTIIAYLTQEPPLSEWDIYATGRFSMEWAEQWRIEANQKLEKYAINSNLDENWIKERYMNDEWSADRLILKLDSYLVTVLAKPLLVANELQIALNIADEMKQEGIYLDNGFYHYWVKRYGESEQLHRPLQHHLARVHQLQNRRIKKSWVLFTNRLLANEEFYNFNDEKLQRFISAVGLPPGAPVKSVDGEYHWTMPFEDGNDFWRWEIMPSGSVLVSFLGGDYSICAGRPFKVELNELMRRFNSIIEKERLPEDSFSDRDN